MSAATYLGCFLAHDRTTIDIAAQVCGRCRKRNRKKVGWSAFPTNGFPAELHRHAELTWFLHSRCLPHPAHVIVILLAPSQPPALLLTHSKQTKMNSFASFVSALFLLLAVSSTSCSAFAPSSSSFTGGQANAVVRSTRQSSSSSTNLSMIFGPKDDGSPGDYVCLGASIHLHLCF